MNELPKISDSELEVMKIIWENKSITSSQIIKILEEKQDWKPATIKTLINRLLKKETINFNKSGKEYYYYPVIEEAEYIKEESTSFINRVFNGSVNSMIMNFVTSKKLSHDDLEELKNLLDKYK